MEENKCEACGTEKVEGTCPNCSVEATTEAPAEGGEEMAAPAATEEAAAPEAE